MYVLYAKATWLWQKKNSRASRKKFTMGLLEVIDYSRVEFRALLIETNFEALLGGARI